MGAAAMWTKENRAATTAAASLESQMTQPIQYLPGQTLRVKAVWLSAGMLINPSIAYQGDLVVLQQ